MKKISLKERMNIKELMHHQPLLPKKQPGKGQKNPPPGKYLHSNVLTLSLTTIKGIGHIHILSNGLELACS